MTWTIKFNLKKKKKKDAADPHLPHSPMRVELVLNTQAMALSNHQPQLERLAITVVIPVILGGWYVHRTILLQVHRDTGRAGLLGYFNSLRCWQWYNLHEP